MRLHFPRPVVLAACALCLAAVPALADMTIEYSTGLSSPLPSGSAPWLRVTIEDTVTDTVQITFENLLHSSSEFISNIWFNTTLSESGWTFSYVSGQNTVSTPTVDLGDLNAPEAGKFDMVFAFETANNSNRFTMGETSVFTVTHAGLDASDFNGLSSKDYLSAAHVQGLAGGASVTIVGDIVPHVPAPTAAFLLLMGIGLVSSLKRRLA